MREARWSERRFAIVFAFAFTAAAAAACDQGPQDDERPAGPPVRVVATNFEGGRTIPANGSVQLAFDRVLHPSTVNRQGVIVLEVSGRAVTNPVVTYDPVTRVVSLSAPDPRGSRWLVPGQPYLVFLTHPEDPDSPGGLRALDGATVERTATRRFAFFAGPEEVDERARGFDPRVEFCRDVLPIFRARCGSSNCHGSPDPQRGTRPRMSLVLDTPLGISNTALRRASQESNTGSRAGLGGPPARVFGVDMPIVDPGNPATSWLLYKLMLAAPAADDPSRPELTCGEAAAQPVVIGTPLARFAPLSADERARFANHVMGSPMPYPEQPGADDRSRNLTFEQLERIRSWISQGAEVTECGGCL
jgi:hypothetical protein